MWFNKAWQHDLTSNIWPVAQLAHGNSLSLKYCPYPQLTHMGMVTQVCILIGGTAAGNMAALCAVEVVICDHIDFCTLFLGIDKVVDWVYAAH